jgi:hypothetical protein
MHPKSYLDRTVGGHPKSSIVRWMIARMQTNAAQAWARMRFATERNNADIEAPPG